MKLLMTVNKVDTEIIEVWREAKMGLQFVAIMHSDSLENDLYDYLYSEYYDEDSPPFVKVSLEVAK